MRTQNTSFRFDTLKTSALLIFIGGFRVRVRVTRFWNRCSASAIHMLLIAELLCGRRSQSGEPRVRKSGNLSIREILVLTSAYVRTQAQTLSGEGEGSPKATRRGEKNEIFSWREIARCFWVTSVFLGGKSHDHRRFWKRGFFKSLSLFSKTIVREWWSFILENKKHLISINGKKKFKRIVNCLFGGRRKVQVSKFALASTSSLSRRSVGTSLWFAAFGSGRGRQI